MENSIKETIDSTKTEASKDPDYRFVREPNGEVLFSAIPFSRPLVLPDDEEILSAIRNKHTGFLYGFAVALALVIVLPVLGLMILKATIWLPLVFLIIPIVMFVYRLVSQRVFREELERFPLAKKERGRFYLRRARLQRQSWGLMRINLVMAAIVTVASSVSVSHREEPGTWIFPAIWALITLSHAVNCYLKWRWEKENRSTIASHP